MMEEGRITLLLTRTRYDRTYGVRCVCGNRLFMEVVFRREVFALLREAGWGTRQGKWRCKACAAATSRSKTGRG